jgi:tetratricopeptide (TPR) repeat protein
MDRRHLMLAILLAAAAPTALGAQHLADAQSRREAVQFYRNGQEFFSAEKFERAAEEFTKATDKDPLFTLAHYQAGQSYMNLKRYASAIKAFQQCLEATRALYGLAETNRFAVEKQRDDEIHEMRESVLTMRALASKNPTGGYGLRAERAEQHLRDLESQRLSLSGGYRPPAEVLLSLGSAFFRNGDTQAATVEWEAAIGVNSRLGEAHNNLAVVYMQAGRLADADREMKLAEKTGFRVNPQFKDDLKARLKAEQPRR